QRRRGVFWEVADRQVLADMSAKESSGTNLTVRRTPHTSLIPAQLQEKQLPQAPTAPWKSSYSAVRCRAFPCDEHRADQE
ncbi:hypothetical protein COLO4_01845, partial [Corchorus olitorius]